MIRPIIAIVGRPNVGKSTLFNCLVGRRQALVRDTPGVTRDRLYGQVSFERWQATVIDTGGFDPSSEEPLITVACQRSRSEEHTSELQSLAYLVCRLLLEKKKKSDKKYLLSL